MVTGQDIFFHTNHPIKWVRVAGVVVAIDEYAQRRIYTVDDSSGVCIECVVALAPASQLAEKEGNDQKQSKTEELGAKEPPEPPAPTIPIPDGLDVGSVVDIKGGLKIFRAEKQVKIEKVALLHTTEQEVAFWNKARQLKVDVLSHPWSLESKVIRRCRKEAEGIDGSRERRTEKKKPAPSESRVSRERQEEKPRATSSRPSGVEKRAKASKIPPDLKGKYNALGI